MVQVLVVRVDIGVVIYEAMTSQCGTSVVQVLIVRVDIRVVTYEAITSQYRRSVVQVLVVRVASSVVRVDIGVVTYKAMTSSIGLTKDMFYLHLLFLVNSSHFHYTVQICFSGYSYKLTEMLVPIANKQRIKPKTRLGCICCLKLLKG